mmetsp:Transcript_29577/g.77586  ORF Transcript_29577/g.77586 Transcript_29577/m.77586 type:complete len:208 (+) Transcript_29577:757-1380(+)
MGMVVDAERNYLLGSLAWRRDPRRLRRHSQSHLFVRRNRGMVLEASRRSDTHNCSLCDGTNSTESASRAWSYFSQGGVCECAGANPVIMGGRRGREAGDAQRVPTRGCRVSHDHGSETLHRRLYPGRQSYHYRRWPRGVGRNKACAICQGYSKCHGHAVRRCLQGIERRIFLHVDHSVVVIDDHNRVTGRSIPFFARRTLTYCWRSS